MTCSVCGTETIKRHGQQWCVDCHAWVIDPDGIIDLTTSANEEVRGYAGHTAP